MHGSIQAGKLQVGRRPRRAPWHEPHAEVPHPTPREGAARVPDGWASPTSSTGGRSSSSRRSPRTRTTRTSRSWRKYWKRVGKDGRTGIWHETFLVRAGEYEAIYGNMPPRGLGKASRLVPVAVCRRPPAAEGCTRPRPDAQLGSSGSVERASKVLKRSSAGFRKPSTQNRQDADVHRRKKSNKCSLHTTRASTTRASRGLRPRAPPPFSTSTLPRATIRPSDPAADASPSRPSPSSRSPEARWAARSPAAAQSPRPRGDHRPQLQHCIGRALQLRPRPCQARRVRSDQLGPAGHRQHHGRAQRRPGRRHRVRHQRTARSPPTPTSSPTRPRSSGVLRRFDRAATVLGVDRTDDLAVVKVDKTGLTALSLGKSADLRIGEPVVAIGNALDLTGGPTATRASSPHWTGRSTPMTANTSPTSCRPMQRSTPATPVDRC